MASIPFDQLLEAAAAAVFANVERLTALDQAIGDGDHGLNLKRGFEAAIADQPAHAAKPAGERLKAVGMQLIMKVGGASGPLMGSFAMEFGRRIDDPPSRAGVVAAFAAAIDAVKARGKSEPGQKTLLDVLVPVHAVLARGGDLPAVRAEADRAAAATVPMRATRGRASFLGERSIGHMDPGACSSALIIGAVCAAIEKRGAA